MPILVGIALFVVTYLNLHWWVKNREARARLLAEQMKPIETEADYKLLLARIQELIECDPPVPSRTVDELHRLAKRIESYEAKHHPLRD